MAIAQWPQRVSSIHSFDVQNSPSNSPTLSVYRYSRSNSNTMPSIKGTSSVTDPRARSKALKATKFPSNFSTPVNLSKVNMPVLTQWIEQRVTTILGFDDEIVSSTAINLFLPSEGGSPDPRRAQLDLVGFLGEDGAASFAKELWSLLLESQSSISGIPRTLLDQKKKELSSKTAPRLPPNMQPASNRNPEMNRFVQEAARRAQAAREMVEAQDPPPAAAAANVPDPIPVSPLHPSEQVEPKQPPPIREEDRKMSPRVDRFGRMARNPPPPSVERPPSRGRYEEGPRRPYASARSSRSRDRGTQDRMVRRGGSRSRSPEHGRSREDDRRRRRDSRERRRYYDEDDDIQDLERRLSDLKRQGSKRRDDYALDEEIEDVKDKIYELERRRRRNRRRQEDEEYYRRKNRCRRDSPEVSRRRSSRSPDSEDSRRRRRSRSRSHDRRRDRSRDRGRREEDPNRDRRETEDNRRSRRSRSSAGSYSSSSESEDSKESK
jgi:serine/arginine repetitive matrix protein 1